MLGGRLKNCFLVLSVLLLGLFFSNLGFGLDMNVLLSIDNVDGDQYDFALTNGAAHIVYSKNGIVYYAKVTSADLSLDTKILGPGTYPTIASDGFNKILAVFNNSDNLYGVDLNASLLNPYLLSNNVGSAKPVLSAPLFSSAWQLIVEGNIDDDGYKEIFKYSYNGSSWSDPTLLLDGFYDTDARYGNYYFSPSIVAFSDGSYAYTIEEQNWGGRASWSDKWAGAKGLETPFGVGGIGWNESISLSRRAINSISENPNEKAAAFAMAIDGSLYLGIYEEGNWRWLLETYQSDVSSAAVSWKGGIYSNSLGLNFITSDENGHIISELIRYENNILYGEYPLIWAMDEVFILFKDSNGVLQFATNANINPIPEPSSILALLSGITGVAATSIKLKRK